MLSTLRYGFVYVIQCSTKRFGVYAYYIGTYKGFDVFERFSEHCRGNETQSWCGSRFTMKYQPMRIIHVEMVPVDDLYLRENELTCEYFVQVPNSIQLVRGGKYCAMKKGCTAPDQLPYWFPPHLLTDALNGRFGDLED